MKNIFITGCCGYIGSHTCIELLESSYEIVGLDNSSNSKREVLDKIKQITNKEITFYEGNMLDKVLLEKIFTENEVSLVIDFAAYKAVGDIDECYADSSLAEKELNWKTNLGIEDMCRDLYQFIRACQK